MAAVSPDTSGQALGFTIWLTGLSGAGKSTISALLATELRRRGQRVEILDGDEVRANLSQELGYSREDRETNIRRVGWVCELLVRNGVIAIAALVSPYRESRNNVRRRVGRFVEVHVTAPWDVLADRDVKGLYGRAAAGEIPNFTGLDDPYEPPLEPEVVCYSDGRETPEGSAARVLRVVERLGYLPADGSG